jgi:hypothetical protein
MGLEYGELFLTPDAVARDFNRIYNPQSTRAMKELGSIIYKYQNGNYSYTKPREGTFHDSRERNQNPMNTRIAGDIHAHADYAIGYKDREGHIHLVGRVNRSQMNWRNQDTFKSDKPSLPDTNYWHSQGKNKGEYHGYVSTPGNYLWKQDGVNQNSKAETIDPAQKDSELGVPLRNVDPSGTGLGATGEGQHPSGPR